MTTCNVRGGVVKSCDPTNRLMRPFDKAFGLMQCTVFALAAREGDICNQLTGAAPEERGPA